VCLGQVRTSVEQLLGRPVRVMIMMMMMMMMMSMMTRMIRLSNSTFKQ